MKGIIFSLLFFIQIVFPIIGNTASENSNVNQDPNSTVTITDRDKYSVVDLHNRVRCQLRAPASAMPNVAWNERLYQVAQNHANKCVFAHNANRSSDYAALGGQGYVGENIFAIGPTGPSHFLATAINAFASEKANFSYVPSSACTRNVCGCQTFENCGHYSQLIWADSTTVACAQSDCSNTPLGGQFVVCNYAPGGNYIGVEPYAVSSLPVDTAACQAARFIPLTFLSTLSGSSNQNQLPNILDEKSATFWTPTDADTQPYITLVFEQPLNVKNIRVRWSNINYSAETVRIEYSTQANGSNLKSLPTQTLPFNINATINVNLTQIRFLKINFLDTCNLKIQLASLAALDPTFSWHW